ncbi:MAG: DUF1697 domain-containing protein [Dehalococcoidia bacterium]
MTTHIALLRGINVGGTKKVAMAELRDFFGALRFDDVQTLLQTGNVVFRADDRAGADLETMLELEARSRLGLDTAFFVRTAPEWESIVERNPFPDAAGRDPGHLVVLALKDAPKPAAFDALRDAIRCPEVIQGDGKQLYVVYSEGIGRSKLTNKLMEGKLGTRVTGRNWNTVLKLAALAGA